MKPNNLPPFSYRCRCLMKPNYFPPFSFHRLIANVAKKSISRKRDAEKRKHIPTKKDPAKKKKHIQRKRVARKSQRDWSDGLPPDIIHFISKKLPDIFELFRFRAVCKTWRFSTTASDSPPQLPWIVEGRGPHAKKQIRFYSLFSRKTLTIPVSKHACFTGSFYGYMFEHNLNCEKLSLFNPITSDHVRLPSPGLRKPYPAYVGSDPIRSGTYAVVKGSFKCNCTEEHFSCACKKMLAYYGPGDKTWTYMECVRGSLAVINGKLFYSEKDTGLTKVIDLATQSVVHAIPRPKEDNFVDIVKFVESAGEILRVTRLYCCIFNIHKLDIGNGKKQPRWVRIYDIGDQVLFLDSWPGVSFAANGSPSSIRNCIYYFDNDYYNYRDDNEDCISYIRVDPYRYDIEDGTIEKLHCPLEDVSGWYTPMAGSELWPYVKDLQRRMTQLTRNFRKIV